MLQVGIIGLPNVGKSTLFNALLKRQQALVANYPFATIEPNVGIVPVPDERLQKLREVIEKQEGQGGQEGGVPIVPATVKFVDIAGLVKGASQGAGLGNKFLAHIREADLIAHVVRAFSDESVIREGSIGPEEDMETVNMELILADLQTLEKVRDEKRDRAPLRCASEGQGDRGGRGGKREAIVKLEEGLNRGKLAREVELDEGEKEAAEELQLLTAKKILYVVNADTKTDWGKVKQLENKYPGQVCVIDAKLEADLAEFAAAEREEYLHSLGIKEAGVDQLIRLAYRQLGLISFLTAPDSAKATPGKGWEVRAWTIKSGTKAPAAAGVIHTDFEKNFIKAEVVDFRDFVILGGWQKCREAGRTRAEGREYEIKDGEVVEFKVGT